MLAVDQDAPYAAIKAAYHHSLLRHHPDKSRQIRTATDPAPPSIALIKEAYETLCDPPRRAAFDAYQAAKRQISPKGQRAAEVVSLEDFTVMSGDEGKGDVWSHPCRCGAMYHIREDQLEDDVHLIGCQGCSEVLWVGYEAALDD